jgi:hypothetical protein
MRPACLLLLPGLISCNLIGTERQSIVRWTLDIDFGDGNSFVALREGLSVSGNFDQTITGRINGYNASKMWDSLFVELYPAYGKSAADKSILAGLNAQGNFSIDAQNLFETLSGEMFFVIIPAVHGGNRITPTMISFELTRW